MRRLQEQHERVKMLLRLAGTSLADVARELRVSPTSVTIVSKGERRSRRIEQAIATKLGTTADLLWPERYADSAGGRARALSAAIGGAAAMT